MKTCILLGDRSHIGKALVPFLIEDGYRILGWNRESHWFPGDDDDPQWDLVLCCLGGIAPVGNWHELDELEFQRCVESNVLLPVRLLTRLWAKRNPNSNVCVMAGSNPQRIMAGYLPYNLSKMTLLKAVEQIDYESPDCKVFALGPGYVKTKIHAATLAANWPNERISRGDDGTPIERIWECLKWCIAQDKSVVGGRNICVSDHWDGFVMGKSKWDMLLADELKANPAMFKLRRVE